MNEEEIYGLFMTMMLEYDFPSIGFNWYDAHDDGVLGAAFFNEDGTPAIIVLATEVIGTEHADEVLSHEFAHFISGSKEHDDAFFAACEITGAKRDFDCGQAGA